MWYRCSCQLTDDVISSKCIVAIPNRLLVGWLTLTLYTFGALWNGAGTHSWVINKSKNKQTADRLSVKKAINYWIRCKFHRTMVLVKHFILLHTIGWKIIHVLIFCHWSSFLLLCIKYFHLFQFALLHELTKSLNSKLFIYGTC